MTGGDQQRIESVRTRAELGALLTELRRRSGYSLRELASAVGSSASTLSGWCRAENLPFASQYDVFAAMLEVLGVEDPGPWLEVVEELRTAGAVNIDAEPPYRGLEPFRPADARRFFGRDRLVTQVEEWLSDIVAGRRSPNMVLLVGPSGSGKSSVLHAGIQPRLEVRGVRCETLTPGPDPMGRLDEVRETGEAEGGSGATPATPMPHAETTPATPTPGGAPGPPVVLLIDQFEEVFTTCDDQRQRDRFLAELDRIANGDAGRIEVVVATLRADFYRDLVDSGYLAAALERGQVIVGPVGEDELRELIVEPARLHGVSIDEDLLEVLVRDVFPRSTGDRRSSTALPLLSHALLETWQRSRRGRMTLEDYREAGGLEHAVERTAERTYQQLDPVEQRLARQLLLRMVHVGSGQVLTRLPLAHADLAGMDGADPDDPTSRAREVVDRFVAARLLTIYEDTVEISHEALLTSWPRLRGWIEDSAAALRTQRRVAEAARLWSEHHHDPSALLRGTQLAAAAALLTDDAPPVALSRTERTFLEASREEEERQQRRERRTRTRLRVLAAVSVVFGLLAGASALLAVDARSNALLARDEALSREIAVTADRVAETDPALAAQLAVAGYEVAPTSQARSALLEASASMQVARYLGGPGSASLAVADDGTAMAVGDASAGHVQLFAASDRGWERAGIVPLADPAAESYALAYSRDAQVLYVGDTTASIGVWDVSDPDDPRRLGDPLVGPDGPIQGLAVSSDDAEVAAVGLGDGVFRWDVTDPAQPLPLALLPHDEITWSVAYAEEPGRLAAGDDLGTVRLWELDDDPSVVAEAQLGDRPVPSVAFGRGDELLAAASRDGVARVLEVGTSQLDPVPLEEPTFGSWVNTVRFTSDGDLLAAGSSDGQVRLWSTRSWVPSTSLPHPAAVTEVRFAPEGDRLVTVATDGTARDWNLDSGPGQVAGSVWNLHFADDGRELVAFSSPQTAVWDLEDGLGPGSAVTTIPTPQGGPVFSGAGAPSADGSLLAQGTFGGEVVVFDRGADREEPRWLTTLEEGADGLVEAVIFSPDGARLAAGGRDTDIRLWDVDGARFDPDPRVLDDPTEVVLNLVWSHGGGMLAAPSADNHVYLYSFDDGEPRLTSRLGGFDSEAFAVAFDPRDAWMAAAGSDGLVLLWDVTDPEEPEQLASITHGPQGRIFDLSFSADGGLVAAAAADGAVWVWDVTTPDAIRALAAIRSGSGSAYTVAFAPDGSHLVASGADGAVFRWAVGSETLADDVCSWVGDPITLDEWRTYFADQQYVPSCGR